MVTTHVVNLFIDMSHVYDRQLFFIEIGGRCSLFSQTDKYVM